MDELFMLFNNNYSVSQFVRNYCGFVEFLIIKMTENRAFANVEFTDSYNSTSDPDRQPLNADEELDNVRKNTETKTYRRRWYVLLVLLISGFVQTWVLNTFLPVAEAMKLIGWNLKYVVSLQIVWYITATIGAAVFIWIIDRKGLRLAMLFSLMTLTVGCGIRCITTDSPGFAILNMIGYIINGLGGALPLGGASVLSSIWFPPKERIFATALVVESANVGAAAAMVIGVSVMSSQVPIIDKVSKNVSEVHLDKMKEAVLSDIMPILYIQFGISAGLLIMALCYYPKTPPMPPSISAACGRTELFKGIKEAFMSWKLWLLFSTSFTMYFCLPSLSVVILRLVGFSQSQSGWLSFSATIFGTIAGLLVSVFAGRFIRRVRIVCLILLGIATSGSIVFTCSTLIDQLPIFPVEWVYDMSIVVSIAALYALLPVCYELSCELVYPVSENVVCLMIQGSGDISIVFLYLLLLIPSRFLFSCTIVGFASIGLVSFICLPECYYNRVNIDETAEEIKSVREQPAHEGEQKESDLVDPD